jgi:predicted component of type VI protein secretion system
LNWEAARLVFEAITFLVAGGASVYVYLSNRNAATNRRIGTVAREIHERVDGHEHRLTKVEAAVGIAPTHDDIAGLKEGVARLQAESAGQTELLRRLTAQVDRINEWLIDRAK